MEENTEIDVEISQEEEMTNNIADVIRGVFKNAGEIIVRIGSITPHGFVVVVVVTEGEDPSWITWAAKFVIVHIPSEKPILIKAFTEAIGFQPFCQYVRNGLLVFEWDWADSKERFAELESEEKMGRIEELQKLEL